MSRPFPAILSKDGLRWIGDPPPDLAGDREVVVDVIVREKAAKLPGPGWNGTDLARLLRQISDGGAFDDITDPVAWERALRSERG
ncbi:hypothetical protein [Rubrivirga sp.]|uniref:hypothetical protein n=1 Tax=Rubrivirga sp. TaxID=1885344 RepID=UPI003B52E523